MTQKEKCDICRSRKVKCDEKRPICGSCKIRGRPCTYKAATAAQYLQRQPKRIQSDDANGLQLLTWAKASSGPGTFFTLGRVPPSSNTGTGSPKLYFLPRGAAAVNPCAPIGSPEAHLAARWTWALERHPSGRNPFQIFGNFIEMIPSLLGRCRPVDLAAQHLIDTYQAYRTQTSAAEITAHRSGAKALASLRQEMARQPQWIAQGDIMWCAMLHYVAEQLRDPNTFRYLIHLNALCKLAKASMNSDGPETFSRTLLLSIFSDEVSTSLASEHDSKLDGIFNLALITPSELSRLSPIESAAELVMRQYIRLPGLVWRLRAYRYSKPEVKVSEAEIIQMAQEMRFGDPGQAVESALAAFTSVITTRTKDELEQAALPHQLQFKSVPALVLFIDYHSYRTLLCGMLQTMFRLGMPMGDMKLASIEEDDLHSARAILSSLEHTASVDPDLPLADLRVIQAVQYAYGSFDRLQRRLSTAGVDLESKEMVIALHLRQLSLDNINSRLARWKYSRHVSHEESSECLESTAGGPLHTTFDGDMSWF